MGGVADSDNFPGVAIKLADKPREKCGWRVRIDLTESPIPSVSVEIILLPGCSVAAGTVICGIADCAYLKITVRTHLFEW